MQTNDIYEQHAFGRRHLYEIVWEPIKSTTSSKNGNAKTKDDDDDDGPTKKKRRTILPKKKDDDDVTVTPLPPSGEQDGPGSGAATAVLSAATTATHRLCLRCRHCHDAADVLRPKSLSEHYFYAKIVRWSANHFEGTGGCAAVPPDLRVRYEEARARTSRGQKRYWAEAAHSIGLRNIVDGEGREGLGVAFAAGRAEEGSMMNDGLGEMGVGGGCEDVSFDENHK